VGKGLLRRNVKTIPLYDLGWVLIERGKRVDKKLVTNEEESGGLSDVEEWGKRWRGKSKNRRGREWGRYCSLRRGEACRPGKGGQKGKKRGGKPY